VSARFTLEQAAWAAGAQIAQRGRLGDREELDGVSTDSRVAAQGALFVALVGETFDGSLFAANAVRGGCAAVLVPSSSAARVGADLRSAGVSAAILTAPDTGRAMGKLAQAWRARMADLRVVAITGSAGKTSTKELVAAVLGAAGQTLKTEGNLNNEVGVPLTLLRLEPQHRFAAIECGMNHLGEIARLAAWSDPDVGIVTNVAAVHLEGLGSIEGVAHAKGELFHMLRPAGVAVANADDPRVLAQAILSKRKLLTFGRAEGASVRLLEAKHEGDGIRAKMSFLDGTPRDVSLRLIGLHNALNAAAAAAAGVALAIDPETIVRGLGEAQTPGRRMRPVPLSEGRLLLDDCYNANPASTAAALDTLAELARGRGRPIAILGDMLELGPGELDLHREVGRKAAKSGLALLITFGERARALRDAAVDAGFPEADTLSTSDPDEAARAAQTRTAWGDVILVKGSRGMRMERISDALSGAAPALGGH
jgi:UDP-N-acetylmuramoyl-tripeptide--D-alanyl-D-alanine ligase